MVEAQASLQQPHKHGWGGHSCECMISVTALREYVNRAAEGQNKKNRKGSFLSAPFLAGPVEKTSPFTAKPLVVTKKRELSLWLKMVFEL